MEDLTPLQRLGMYGVHEPLHPAALEDCVLELYRRVEKLEATVSYEIPGLGNLAKLIETDTSGDVRKTAREEREAQNPEYNEAQCLKLFTSVFKNSDKIKEAECYLIDTVYDYLDHHETFNHAPLGDKALREWGAESHRLHCAMKDAAKELSEL